MIAVGLLFFWGGLTALTAAPDATTPTLITMKSPSTFTIDDRNVSANELIPTLKKNKIPNTAPLMIEVPANTRRDVLKELSQRLMSAGYTPIFKPPRHADASVKNLNTPTTVAPSQKQKSRK
jgi:hypothetical protein